MNYKEKRVCVICVNEFMAWRNSKTKTCSPSCKKELRELQTINRYEKTIGEPLDNWLRRKYVDELWSYRDIIKALGIQNVSAIIKIMRRFDIPVRKGSEAVATQWEKDPDRRKMQRNLPQKSGIIPVKGGFNYAKLPEVGKKISLAKKNHPMYKDKNWYKKVCKSIQIRQKEKPPTDIEAIMQIALEEAGLKFERQKHVDVYTVDFAVENNGNKLAIECDGSYWHNMPERIIRDSNRDKIISDSGWTVIRFTEKDIKSKIDKCLNTIFAALGY